ncbi:hypothetical protein M404DRAFT_510488 [Pisolithus tinctorius Marx 270]|uniref:Uncharacterized protein n=1 Tax=Pisolithus tinctorius Marx 270 TaxID=870435 RepID=A0A0C3NC81_PISTI|nr:hypothetical protein M404DRAFT_510488 [Pisolithus tinctorius Marx 270]
MKTVGDSGRFRRGRLCRKLWPQLKNMIRSPSDMMSRQNALCSQSTSSQMQLSGAGCLVVYTYKWPHTLLFAGDHPRARRSTLYHALSGCGRHHLGSELMVAVWDKNPGENRVIGKLSNVSWQFAEANRRLREIR